MDSWKACMPTKCMDQMPVPITSAPASHQAALAIPRVLRTRSERLMATNEASVATRNEAATAQAL
jgi:hypothetical protein